MYFTYVYIIVVGASHQYVVNIFNQKAFSTKMRDTFSQLNHVGWNYQRFDIFELSL